ncbi:MAG: hypothetical protein AMJ46_09910 [Latescibacteria bacterium DG_63]|nr:MAG: hypothetical protein AMJ46_09910 [Latescibacteria bacterium DG_63]
MGFFSPRHCLRVYISLSLLPRALVAVCLLSLLQGFGWAAPGQSAELRVAVLASQLSFRQNPTESRYGSMTLGGVRLSCYVLDGVEPHVAFLYGRSAGEYPDLITTKWWDAGLRVNLSPYRRLRFYAGFALYTTGIDETLYYSPCLPGNAAVLENHWRTGGYQVICGPEWHSVFPKVSVGLEFRYVGGGRAARGSTAEPFPPRLSGIGGVLYICLDL